jgi:hypothetical protein
MKKTHVPSQVADADEIPAGCICRWISHEPGAWTRQGGSNPGHTCPCWQEK